MKTLKAITNYLQGYKLHIKERRRLEDLWVNIRTIGLTIIIAIVFIWLINEMGCTSGKVTLEELNDR